MAATPSPSEIINLLLILLLVPLTVMTLRRFRHSGRIPLAVGYVAITVGFVLGVTEHLFLGTITRDIKTLLYALGAVGFALGMWQLKFAVGRREV
jgi:hypothetical protein